MVSESFVVVGGGGAVAAVVAAAGTGVGGVSSSGWGVGSRTSRAVGRREGDNCIICKYSH